jgi:hypothetical protein
MLAEPVAYTNGDDDCNDSKKTNGDLYYGAGLMSV